MRRTNLYRGEAISSNCPWSKPSLKLESRFKIEWPGVIDARKLSGESKSFIVRATKCEKSWDFEKWSSKSSSIILTKPHVLSSNFFFQAALENFLWALRQRWRHLGCSLDFVLCVSKKSWPYDAPIWLYVRKSEKSWDFEKWSSKSCRIFWQNPMFWTGTFFSNDSRKFSMRSTTTFKVSGGSA